MTRQIGMVFALDLFVAVPLAADETEKDLEKMQGSWRVVSAEVAGKKATEQELKQLEGKMTIKGEQVTIKNADQIFEGNIKIDATKMPRTIDLTGTNQKGQTDEGEGIYELESDRLKICAVLKGGERPKEFKTEAGNPRVSLIVYQKEK